MVTIVRMNGKEIARFSGSKQLNITSMDEAKLYLDSLKKLFPEAKIEE